MVIVRITCEDGDFTRSIWSMTVQWDDGHRTTHCTPWNPALGDGQLPSPSPPSSAPRPPEPQRRDADRYARCTSRFALIRAAHRLGLL